MNIRRYVSGLLLSNMYLIVEGDHAVVIDPFEDIVPAKGLTIDYIFLTHEHYDHISGVNDWKEAMHPIVVCSKTCAANIQNPKKNLASHFKEFCELQTWIHLDKIPASDPYYFCRADTTFDDEVKIKWQGHEFHLTEIPGHSPGSIRIMLDGTDYFSGDSLMKNCEIELRLPGGSRKKWKEPGSKRIEKIPQGTRIWPGHFDGFILHKMD